MKVDFEDFLQEKHCEQYRGIKDHMCDDYADWLADLDPEEFIDFGQEYAEKCYNKS